VPSGEARPAVARERSAPPALALVRRAPAPLKPRPNEGRAVNGLQLTLHVPHVTHMMPDGSNCWSLPLHFIYKNVGKQPLKLDMSPALVVATRLEVKGPNAHSVRFVPRAIQRELFAPVAKDFPVIEPGKTWSRMIGFPRDFPRHDMLGSRFYLLEPGRYRFRATYTLTAPTNSPFAAGSWTGTVVSNELTVRVLPNRSDLSGFGPVHGLCARLSFAREQFAAGEAITPTYEVMNVSKDGVTIWHSGFWPNHRIIVRDGTGREAPLTKEGQQRRKAFSPGGGRDKNVAVTLAAGGRDTTQGSYDLTKLYDLSRPDRYTVEYVYEDRQPGGWQGRLPSNVPHFVVVAKKN